MTILSINFAQIGQVPIATGNNTFPAATQTPTIVYIATNDTNATVTTAGYLNTLQQSTTDNFVFNNTQMALVYTTDDGVQFYQISITAGVITLVPDVNPGNVLLPVVANHLAVFTNVAGQIGDPINTTATHLGNINAGDNTHPGILRSFPIVSGGANDFMNIRAITAGGNFTTTISNSVIGQTTTYSLTDPGAATANFIISASAGTQTITTGNLALTLGAFQTLAGNITAGSSGHAGVLTTFPATAANGSLILAAVNSPANFSLTISNAAMGQATVVSVPDPGAATANFLLDAGAGTFATDYQRMVEAKDFMLAAAGGAFTLTRNAQGDWSWLHTTAADTSVLGFDISEALRAAAGFGFELTSFDVVYSIATLALVAHTVTLAKTVFANNVANAITNVAITGALATATQANPYVTNVTVNAPAFANPAAGTSVKYVVEVTVNAAATSVYNIWGINLRFTKSIK